MQATPSDPKWIRLNVGGKHFLTDRSTLQMKVPSSMLARMFASEDTGILSPGAKDEQGAVIIDRSPKYFEPILNYLRTGALILDQNVNPEGKE